MNPTQPRSSGGVPMECSVTKALPGALSAAGISAAATGTTRADPARTEASRLFRARLKSSSWCSLLRGDIALVLLDQTEQRMPHRTGFYGEAGLAPEFAEILRRRRQRQNGRAP